MKFIQQTRLIIVTNLSLAGLAMAVPQDLVDGLGDENFLRREKAEKELALWAKEQGKSSLDDLNKLKARTHSPEVRSRLKKVILGVEGFAAIPGTRGYMGIVLLPRLGFVDISRVEPNSPADKAGLKVNDEILEVDGVDLSKKTNNLSEALTFVQNHVKSKKAGEKLTLKIERDGKELTKTLKLADYDIYLSQLNFNNGGAQVIPVPGKKGIQMKIEIMPKRGNKLNPDQLMEKLPFELKLVEPKEPLDKEKEPKEANPEKKEAPLKKDP